MNNSQIWVPLAAFSSLSGIGGPVNVSYLEYKILTFFTSEQCHIFKKELKNFFINFYASDN